MSDEQNNWQIENKVSPVLYKFCTGILQAAKESDIDILDDLDGFDDKLKNSALGTLEDKRRFLCCNWMVKNVVLWWMEGAGPDYWRLTEEIVVEPTMLTVAGMEEATCYFGGYGMSLQSKREPIADVQKNNLEFGIHLFRSCGAALDAAVNSPTPWSTAPYYAFKVAVSRLLRQTFLSIPPADFPKIHAKVIKSAVSLLTTDLLHVNE